MAHDHLKKRDFRRLCVVASRPFPADDRLRDHPRPQRALFRDFDDRFLRTDLGSDP